MNDIMNLSKYFYLLLLFVLILFTSCLFKEKIILDSETRPTYHPKDENKILFNAYDRKIFGKSNVYLLDKSNNKITKITNSNYFFDPVFSPDGKKIAYIKRITNREGGDLWIMDSDGTNNKQLTDTDYYDIYPSFSKERWK